MIPALPLVKTTVGNREIKNFVFPSNFHRSRSVKNSEFLGRAYDNPKITNKGHKKIADWSIDLPFNQSSHAVVHTYALPKRLLNDPRSEKTLDLRKFNRDMVKVMLRFEKRENINHIVKIERKGVVGSKRNPVLAKKLLRAKPNP